MNKFYTLLLSFLFVIGFGSAQAQTGILDPSDPIVEYNPSSPPAVPNWGILSKWVRTNRLSWNSTSYKAYYYKGVHFRLKFPKSYQHGVNDGKKYPLIIFWHGIGEKGTVYDNEYSLLHGGELHRNAVDNGQFDGFLLYPQNIGGYFGNVQFDAVRDLIYEHLVPEVKVDQFRIVEGGLSGGGGATWEFMIRHPKVVAAATPISASNAALTNSLQTWKFIPVWLFQGGSDVNPYPASSQGVYNAAMGVGANMKYSEYAGFGHGCWYQAWGEADYFPFANRAHKANPWALFGRTEFCPGDPINVTLGVTAGFDQYEWRKNGEVIPGATSNTLTVTSIGTYDMRLRDGSTWSPWSPVPVQIKIKQPTVSPNITLAGLSSKVLPALDGKDSVVLQVPAGYTSYLWKKATDGITLGTQRTFTAKDSGLYVVKVTEQFGCSSEFSVPFKVVKATGIPAPPPASSLQAKATSQTQVQLDWSDNPNPANNETGFEIYRGEAAGGSYKLVAITAPNTTTYTDNGLNPNKTYYYVVRAVNENGAAPSSNEASATTQLDTTPPTAPGALTVTSKSRTSVGLSWTASTDNVGVNKYDIYINGSKVYTLPGTQTSFNCTNLVPQQSYNFIVKARDLTGNVSPASNQVQATAVMSGLNYKHYHGSFDVLPDFSTLTPVKTGNTPTADISVRTQNDNFAFLWEGYINIPVTGNYTFETYSDDGSKLYIGTYSHTATPVVNNDGLHGSVYAEGTKYLTAGVHPFAATFFEKGGGEEMKIYWKNTAHGVNGRQEIPASAFMEQAPPLGAKPAAPTNILATAVSYSKINLTWNDNSTNETGFEVYRATSLAGPFQIITTTAANAVSYADSLLQPATTYYYKVQAINSNGNSGFAAAEAGGLEYGYYEFSDITQLPNFNNQTPVKTGAVENVTLNVRNRENNYAIKFSGFITIPTTGTYTFYTASDDGSKLYINTFNSNGQVVNNDYLQGTTERSGTKQLNAGVYPIYITFFQRTGGAELRASYSGPGIAKQQIPNAALANPRMSATTLPLPPAPAAPTTLTAANVQANQITLQWNDNDATEAFFEIYRSVGDNSNFKLQDTVSAGNGATAVFTDEGLFANVNYFYKVRAVNIGGNSAFSNEITALTLNNAPVLNDQPNRFMRYDAQLSVPVIATDADAEQITLAVTNLPAFGTFTDNGDGTGTILFSNPGVQDTYGNITITATDQHGDVASKVFQLTVNANYKPILGAVSNTTLAENATTQINLAVTNDNGTDDLTWTYTNLPSFATVVSNGKNSQVTLHPTFADAGTYNVTAKVADNMGGDDTKSFTIVVNDVNPNFFVYVNFNGAVYDAPAPWNNTKKPAMALNTTITDLKDHNGNNTGYGIKVITPWNQINYGSNLFNGGMYTYQNSGVFPDNVMVSSFWTTSVKQTFQVTGLNPNYKYNFTFSASRNASGNYTADYSINGTTVSLNASMNTTGSVTIPGVSPDANGIIPVDLQAPAGSLAAHIGGMKIEAVFDDGTAPVKPTNFAARNTASGIRLSWKDLAYNETKYEIYRSTTENGTYELLNPSGFNANDTAYTDATSSANVQYYYTIRGVNAAGASGYTDTIAILGENKLPVVSAISNVNLKTGDVLNIPLTATDSPGETLTFTTTGLPAFATLNNTGNGAGSIDLAPTNTSIGKYTVTVTATDSYGGKGSQTFTISVRDKNITSIYVNCNAVNPEGAPWNNFNTHPIAGRAITNMLDETGAASGVTITLVDAMTGSSIFGPITGDNSGVYPDKVMNTLYFEQSATPKRIRLSGLSAAKKYNLVFFGSEGNVSDNRMTVYTAGGQSVQLQAANNISNTVQLNGLVADGSGNIEFTVSKGAGALYAYLNALVIQSYVETATPLAPDNLKAQGKSRTSIQLNWSNKASNVTGIEIYRAATLNGTYSLVTTVAANATSYLDNNRSENTRYFYKIRAKNGSNFSDYSATASGSTLSHSIYINFNVNNPAGAPWNNTNQLPNVGQNIGQTLENMKDDMGNPVSTIMFIHRNFTGTIPNGMNTGNNSGIYPDAVMSVCYYVDKGDTAGITFSGLNQSMAYSFIFFASRQGGGDKVIGAYTINGKTVELNGQNNISETVRIDNVVPDENGEIRLSINAAPSGQLGYINGLVIEAASRPQPEGGQQGSQGMMMARNSGAGSNTNVALIDDQAKTAGTDHITIENAYPNPATSFMNVLVKNDGKPEKVVVKLFDASGRIIMAKPGLELPSGTQLLRVDFNPGIRPGIYILQIATPDNRNVKVIKVIKQ